MHSLSGSLMVACLLAPSAQAGGDRPKEVHAAYRDLLDRYVTSDGLVAYERWSQDPEDLSRLSGYVDALERAGPPSGSEAARLAYWIDLYNATTLELVLAFHPVSSIRDIPGPESSPWRRLVISVGGDSLSLDDVEHGIIRKRFQDARVHFALNCASVGCPRLAQEPYSDASLDDRLARAARLAVADPRWVEIDDERVVLSQLFEWFEDDFVTHAGSVAAFIEAHLARDGAWPEGAIVSYREYDWSLNAAE